MCGCSALIVDRSALANALKGFDLFLGALSSPPSAPLWRVGGAKGGLDASLDLYPVNVRHHSQITLFVTHAQELSLIIRP